MSSLDEIDTDLKLSSGPRGQPGGDLEDGEIQEDTKYILAGGSVSASASQAHAVAESASLTSDESNPASATLSGSPSITPVSAVAFRPMSPEELDRAKSLVLDLLGWGVQPEYLLEYGVSARAIYRIFTDLHLRLPSNLASYPVD